MNTINTVKTLLNDQDRQRLESFAPLFDVIVDRAEAPENVKLRVLDKGGWRESTIKRERLHMRLLTELCSKTTRWVYYPTESPCANTQLLGQPDKKIHRLAELYQQQKATLLGLTDDDLVAA